MAAKNGERVTVLRRPDAARQRDMLGRRLQPLGVAGSEEQVVAFAGIWLWFGLFTLVFRALESARMTRARNVVFGLYRYHWTYYKTQTG